MAISALLRHSSTPPLLLCAGSAAAAAFSSANAAASPAVQRNAEEGCPQRQCTLDGSRDWYCPSLLLSLPKCSRI
eukprot:3234376-Rhodomonas_salina.1